MRNINALIKKVKLLPGRIKSRFCLKKIDYLKIPDMQDEIRLFMVVRNESLRLPYTLKHYAQLGVDRFFVIDNGSSDGTIPFLLKQKSTHVFSTQESYSYSNYGINWLKILLDKYGSGHWCLVVDADEIFIYPNYEKVSIKRLCNFLDNSNATAVDCMLLDMYSNKPVNQVLYKKGENFLLQCPYFDPSGYWIESLNWDRDVDNNEIKRGGPRFRVLKVKVCLNKIPLLKYSKTVNIFPGMHFVGGTKLSDIKGCVLHFPFFSDFPSKVLTELQRGQHWGNAGEYKLYARKLKEKPNLNLFDPKISIKYLNSKQLLSMGLMKTTVRKSRR
jgi:glycosyltransferase involved in cell wall biosynthesis